MTQYESVFDALADTPAEAENLKARAALMQAITKRLDGFGWSQSVAAKNLGVTQPRISELKHGKLSRFSLDTLVNMAVQVGLQVRLEVTESERWKYAS
jgi:predicted XRE-type DNA-binding protein